jgi:hypothetical protein
MAKTRLSALPKPSKRPQTGAVQTLRKFGRRRAEGAAAHGVQRLAAAGNGFGGVAELLGRAGGWSVACLAWASLGLRPCRLIGTAAGVDRLGRFFLSLWKTVSFTSAPAALPCSKTEMRPAAGSPQRRISGTRGDRFRDSPPAAAAQGLRQDSSADKMRMKA